MALTIKASASVIRAPARLHSRPVAVVRRAAASDATSMLRVPPNVPSTAESVVLDAARDPAPRPTLEQALEVLATPHNVLLLNGRLAMGGMAAGMAGELLHHIPLATQILAGAPALLAAVGVLTLASAMPLLLGEEEGDEVFGPFTPAAEMINGCVAIAGVVGLLAIEAFKGTALF